MTASLSTIASMFPAFAGLAVLSADKTGAETEYKIARLDSKVGTMKSGEKAEYVVMTRADDEAIVVSIHPNIAAKLFKNGEVDKMKIKPVSAEEVLNAEAEAALQAELQAELASDVKGEEVVEEPKAPSKKERALAIYAEVVAANGARKEVIARFVSELGMGQAGSSTYYQNCKKLWA